MTLKQLLRDIGHKVFFVFIHVTNRLFSGGVSFEYPLLANANPFVLLIKNIVRPKRMYMKFRYGQLGPLSRIASLAGPAPKDIIEAARRDDLFERSVRTFKEDGALIIDGHFKDLAQEITDSINFPDESKLVPFDGYDNINVCPFTDEAVFRILTDPLVLGIAASYLHAQPYFRNDCTISLINPKMDQSVVEDRYRDKVIRSAQARAGGTGGTQQQDIPEVNGNGLWHYDTVNNITAVVLLRESKASESHLKLAAGSHRYHHLQTVPFADYEYSEQYVTRHFDIIDCVGSVGTLFMFDTNGLHRLEQVPGKGRLQLAWCMGPGNNQRFDPAHNAKRFDRRPVPPADIGGLMAGQMNFFRDYPYKPDSP